MNGNAWLCLVVALLNSFAAGACAVGMFLSNGKAPLNFGLVVLNVAMAAWNINSMIGEIG